MRYALVLFLGLAALAGVVAVGLADRPGAAPSAEPGPVPLDQARERLAGAPPELAALHAQAGELLPGGRRALRERLAGLRGRPVVIVKWASWCGPCRIEAPFLSAVAVERGRDVAFIGLDWRDDAEQARAFLDELPLPFPSYADPEGRIARALRMPETIPVTLFLDEQGKMAYQHQGGYRTRADLAADIDRYLGVT